MTPDELAAARRARAQRWATAPTMHSYPALADEEETEQMLAAEPPKRSGKKPKQKAE
jgi:hypothetical protein